MLAIPNDNEKASMELVGATIEQELNKEISQLIELVDAEVFEDPILKADHADVSAVDEIEIDEMAEYDFDFDEQTEADSSRGINNLLSIEIGSNKIPGYCHIYLHNAISIIVANYRCVKR